jgi:hypothetical protein
VADFGVLQNQQEYDHAELIGTRKDVFCFEMLHRFGGVYVDCDFESYKCLESLLVAVVAFAGWQDGACVNTAIMGCTPGNDDFKILVDGIHESFATPGNADTGLAGPVYLTRMLPLVNGLTLFSPEHFYPYLWTGPYLGKDAYPEAYAAHHWAGVGWSPA